ncbi:hypothetical protein [Sphingomonas sp. C3-2]|uniref:hypothetical protein n=1 Tax=Sphingomonas sp. C3-2 TaxID=3062169 RepID=UPI00294B84B8|nr:hypothetical protein [Sphingomonas sp. C3-2]WOK37876.1 hypothetical protein QYC26_06740 [Sphingomonas sp. C3-2]
MTDTNLLWILVGLVLLVALIWIVRSRTGSTDSAETPSTPIEPQPAPKAVAEPEAVAAPQAFVAPAPVAPSAPVATPVAEPVTPAQPKVETPAPAAPAPVAEPVAEAPAPAPSGADNLLQLKGVGPKLAALLTSLGITSFAQIAGWDDAEIDRIDSQLGNFKGRIRRDKWVEQAGFLAKGDVAEFEERFGKLDR